MKLNSKWHLLGNNTRYFVVTGGRGGGKSFALTTFLCALTFENNIKILFTRETMTSAETSIIPEFKEKIELFGLVDDFYITRDKVINKSSRSEIIFKGLKNSSGNQTAKLKSLHNISVFVLDESEELQDEGLFDKINLSIRSVNSQNRVILILNPASKSHWIYKKFFENKGVAEDYTGVKDDVTYIHTTYQDNLDNLSLDFIKEIETIRDIDEEKFNHVALGKWRDKVEGVIYRNFELGEFIDLGNCIYGLDFGFSVDPTALVKISVDKSQKIIYAKELLYNKGLTTTPIINHLRSLNIKEPIIADSAEGRLIEEIKQAGFKIIPTTKGAGSVKEGIKLVQDYKIVVDRNSSNLIKELNNYAWLINKEMPQDANNHLLDALRYAFTYYLGAQNKGKYNVS